MSDFAAARRIREWRGVDRRVFHDEIVPLGQPAVLKGLAAGWPLVRAAVESPEAAGRLLVALDSGEKSPAVLLAPEHGGRMFYGPELDGFNFLRAPRSVTEILAQLARYSRFERPPSVAVQCADVARCLPGFAAAHAMPLLDAAVTPRLWLGNAFLTPAHVDELDNLACVAAGRRRFTLFPPEQVGNLYVGPFEHTPAGAPVSLVSLKAPDFEHFPRFREALAAAQDADLEPGDALYIPAVWWHHVESFDVLNVLVNYWWAPTGVPAPTPRVAPTQALVHALLAVRRLPAAQRAAWQAVFDHYVFAPPDGAVDHIPPAHRGVLGDVDPARAADVLASLLRAAPDQAPG